MNDCLTEDKCKNNKNKLTQNNIMYCCDERDGYISKLEYNNSKCKCTYSKINSNIISFIIKLIIGCIIFYFIMSFILNRRDKLKESS